MNMNSYSCCSVSSESQDHISTMLAILQSVGQDSRLKILSYLSQGDHCVCELSGHTHMSQTLISHHLKHLRDVGLVSGKKRGLRVYYSLTDHGKSIFTTLLSVNRKKSL